LTAYIERIYNGGYMKKETQKKVLFSLDADLFESVRDGAKHAGITKSAFIRAALQEKLRRIEREKFVTSLQNNKKTR
jgi:hypothetical protein